MLRAVITAGGRVEGAFAAAIGTSTKALAPFGAGVLIDPALAALRRLGVADIAVVGGPDVEAHLSGAGVRHIPAIDDGATNVLAALDAWAQDDLLFLTSDMPFVDAATLSAFVAASSAYDLTMPLADGAAYEAAYPGAGDHVTVLGAARVANGSAFFISAAGRPAIRRVAEMFFNARKSRFAMARLLGPMLLARFVLKRLTIDDVERRAAQILCVHATGIRESAPALCYDVDSLEDYRYACART